MVSEAVSFEVTVNQNSRRRLQTAAQMDLNSPAFRSSLASAIAATLGAGITPSQVTVSATMAFSNKLLVTIIGFGTTTPSAIVDVTSSPAFIGTISTSVGVSVEVTRAPVIFVRTTPNPSPPPAAPPAPPTLPPPPPPTPPPMPSSPPYLVAAETENLGAGPGSALTNQSSDGLSSAMLWVIIVGVLVVLLIAGCGVVYVMGKVGGRNSTTVKVGRPALRRQKSGSVSHESNMSFPGEITPPRSADLAHERGDGGMANVRLDDVRLIELGMAVERQMSVQRQTSEGSFQDEAEAGLSMKQLDAMQAGTSALVPALVAINAVREGSPRGISPRGSSPRSSGAGLSDGRIKKTFADIDEAI